MLLHPAVLFSNVFLDAVSLISGIYETEPARSLRSKNSETFLEACKMFGLVDYNECDGLHFVP